MPIVQALISVVLLNTVHCQEGCDPNRETWPCNENSVYCSPPGGSYDAVKCVCKAGYEEYAKSGNTAVKCKDINECVDRAICGDPFVCHNTNGSFECACPEGQGHVQGRCVECDYLSQCGENSNYCYNGMGKCTCRPGYLSGDTVDGKLNCNDIDECGEKPDLCGNRADCVNTLGSYKCECKAGFALQAHGSTSCQDIDECVGNDPCDDDEICRNNEGSYWCEKVVTPKDHDVPVTVEILEDRRIVSTDQKTSGSGFQIQGNPSLVLVLLTIYAGLVYGHLESLKPLHCC